MALLSENVQKQVRQVFDGMEGPVKLVYFTQADTAEGLPAEGIVTDSVPAAAIECGMCSDTRQLVEEIAGLSDKITLEVHDFLKDKEVADQYQIDKIPAIAILGGAENKDYGIRLYGIPSGYEFGTVIEDIMMVSKGKPELSKKTLEQLGKLDRPVHIQVYTTPT